MRVGPIPKGLLIHSVSYEAYTGMQTWGETYAAPVTLTNVLVQPETEVIRDTVREAVNARAVLFYDVENSAPAIADFVEKSLIRFDNHVYTIDNVKIFYAFEDSPHHYEITLV